MIANFIFSSNKFLPEVDLMSIVLFPGQVKLKSPRLHIKVCLILDATTERRKIVLR